MSLIISPALSGPLSNFPVEFIIPAVIVWNFKSTWYAMIISDLLIERLGNLIRLSFSFLHILVKLIV